MGKCETMKIYYRFSGMFEVSFLLLLSIAEFRYDNHFSFSFTFLFSFGSILKRAKCGPQYTHSHNAQVRGLTAKSIWFMSFFRKIYNAHVSRGRKKTPSESHWNRITLKMEEKANWKRHFVSFSNWLTECEHTLMLYYVALPTTLLMCLMVMLLLCTTAMHTKHR